MSATKYLAEFINYFVVITIGCILFNIISNRFLSIYWQNAILIGFLWALVYTTIKILIRNKYRAKK
ncbi:hypothetical protein L0Z72_08155 [candidate division KSB1 bacterium]|nr:hypothetical protein [candidate division KSB1 bacterium]